MKRRAQILLLSCSLLPIRTAYGDPCVPTPAPAESGSDADALADEVRARLKEGKLAGVAESIERLASSGSSKAQCIRAWGLIWLYRREEAVLNGCDTELTPELMQELTLVTPVGQVSVHLPSQVARLSVTYPGSTAATVVWVASSTGGKKLVLSLPPRKGYRLVVDFPDGCRPSLDHAVDVTTEDQQIDLEGGKPAPTNAPPSQLAINGRAEFAAHGGGGGIIQLVGRYRASGGWSLDGQAGALIAGTAIGPMFSVGPSFYLGKYFELATLVEGGPIYLHGDDTQSRWVPAFHPHFDVRIRIVPHFAPLANLGFLWIPNDQVANEAETKYLTFGVGADLEFL